MKISHFKKYLSDSYQLNVTEGNDEEIITGQLIPIDGDGPAVEIINSIPRFINEGNYADNFGLQWNKFKSTQLDSVTGLSLTAKRFWTSTKWTPDELVGKTVLEVGSGAGRFTEILLASGAKVVSFDYSNAVDANYINNSKSDNLFIFQGDLYNIPFPDDYFDYVLCYGVLQHTPDLVKAYQSIYSKLRPGGKLSVDCYRKINELSPWYFPKYFWRPITKRLKPEWLLRIIKCYMPVYLPIDTLIRKVPKIGYTLAAIILVPCWNYMRQGLSDKQRLEWAIMDTFDALGATYDSPQTLEQIQQMVASQKNFKEEVFYGGNGIVANITKK